LKLFGGLDDGEDPIAASGDGLQLVAVDVPVMAKALDTAGGEW